MKKHATTIIFVLIMLVGLSLLLYPTVSDWWNSFHQSRAIAAYVEAVDNLSEEEYQLIWDRAAAFNERISHTGIMWEMSSKDIEEYNSLLNISGNGIMGYIEIPSLGIKNAIYHGTDESILQVGVGHIESSSLPIGGENTHSVLSGHRGLPSARLFTDLDKMVESDVFYLTILKEKLTYQVDQIRIVEPEDVSNLEIEKGQDYCTLVTCTPYGVNSHRLLIRGKRIPNENEIVIIEDAKLLDSIYLSVIFMGILFVILLLIVLVRHRKRR